MACRPRREGEEGNGEGQGGLDELGLRAGGTKQNNGSAVPVDFSLKL